jgi:ABC-type transport system involved in cytochrome bd biosynthesis fused ATPase/permease subunit/organic radical activating enzyme
MKSPYQKLLEDTRAKLAETSPSFCLAKWTQSTIHLHRGLTHSCHHPKVHKIPLSEIDQSPASLHNTNEKLVAREQMLRGEFPEECVYCWNIEKLGEEHFSDRILKSKDPWSMPHLQEILANPLSKNSQPRYLEVSFSKACNFKCSYCAPSFSSKWSQEILKFGPYKTRAYEQQPHDLKDPFEEENNPYIEAFWKWWPEIRAGLHTFRITGGEPLLSENTFKVLEEIAKNPLPNLELCINTNLGAPPERMERFFAAVEKIAREKKVKKIQLYTSIEAAGAKAEYIRHGLVEKDFWSNLEKFLGIDDSLSATIMATYNLMSVSSFCELLERVLLLRKKFSPPGSPARLKIDISYLRHPYFLAANVLPLEMTKQLDEQLAFMERNKSDPQKETRGFYVFEIIKMARLAEWAKRGLEPTEKKRRMEEFLDFISEHDRRRGTNFLSIFPEYRDFFVACGFQAPVPAMIRNRFPHFSDVILEQGRWLKYLVVALISLFASGLVLGLVDGVVPRFLMGGLAAISLLLVWFVAERSKRSLASGFYAKVKKLLSASFSEEIPVDTLLAETNKNLNLLWRAFNFVQASILLAAVAAILVGSFLALWIFGGLRVFLAAPILLAVAASLGGALFFYFYRRFQKDMSTFQNYFRQLLIELEQKPADRSAPEGEESAPVLNAEAPPLELSFLDHIYDGVRIFQKCNYRFDSHQCVGVRGTNRDHVEGLYQLLKRKVDPKDGVIGLYGQDIRSFSKAALEETLKILGPGELCLGKSLRENLQISHPAISNKTLQGVLDLVAVDEFADGPFSSDEPEFFQFQLKVARALLSVNTKILYFRNPFGSMQERHHLAAAKILNRVAQKMPLILVELENCKRLDAFSKVLSFRKDENPTILHQSSLFPMLEKLREGIEFSSVVSGLAKMLMGLATSLAFGFSLIRFSMSHLPMFLGSALALSLLWIFWSARKNRNESFQLLKQVLHTTFADKVPTIFWEARVQQYILQHDRAYQFWLAQGAFGLGTLGSIGLATGAQSSKTFLLAAVSLVGWLYFWNKSQEAQKMAKDQRLWMAKKIEETPDERFIEVGTEEIFHLFLKTSSAIPNFSPPKKRLYGARKRLPLGEKARAPLLQLYDLSHGKGRLKLFERFHFTFAPHEAAAIVGDAFGCVDEFERLMRRERDPQSGSVRYFEQDIRDYSRAEYERSFVTCTPTEPIYFASPAAHLRVIFPEVSPKKIRSALSFVGWNLADSEGLKRFRLKIARLYLNERARVLLFRQTFKGLSEKEVELAVGLLNKLATIKQLVLFESDCISSAKAAQKIFYLRAQENPLYSTFAHLYERQPAFQRWADDRMPKNEKKLGIKLKKSDGTSRTLWWRMQNHELASLWWKNFSECLAENPSAEAEQRFFGWRYSPQDQEQRVQILNRAIETINRHFGSRYHISERAFVEMDQEVLNRLHHHFEVLMGQSWRPSEYLQGIPKNVLQAVRTINNLVHDFEYAARLEKSPKGHRKVYGLQLKLPPGKQIPLPNEAFSLFCYENQIGDIVTDYCQLGKTWGEAYFDQDSDILLNNISPLRYYSSSFISNFHELPTEEAEKIEQSVKSYIRSRKEALGAETEIHLDPEDPKNALGHVLLARLDYLSEVNAPDEREFSEFEKIQSVELKDGDRTMSYTLGRGDSFYE